MQEPAVKWDGHRGLKGCQDCPPPGAGGLDVLQMDLSGMMGMICIYTVLLRSHLPRAAIESMKCD
jgi:hypothetical protein